jgi:hypothetical protein
MSPSPTDTADTSAASYERAGHAIVRGLVSPEVASFLVDCADVLAEAGAMKPDAMVAGSLHRYGDATFDTVLRRVTPRVSEATGLRLVPTYSYLRLYRRGQELVPHRDRPECEHSASLQLGASGGGTWPLCLRDGDGPVVEANLAAGDAVLYRGDRLLHWRDPLTDDWHLQVFLHWVDADGPNGNRRFDHRDALGTPSARRVG